MESASPYPSLNAAAAYVGSCIVLLMVSWSAWAAQGDLVSVDNWTEYPVGVLPVSGPGKWKIYSSMKVFKHPPSVVIDEDRRALLLKTDRETMAIGRSIHADIATTRILVWEWEAVGSSRRWRCPRTCCQAERSGGTGRSVVRCVTLR